MRRFLLTAALAAAAAGGWGMTAARAQAPRPNVVYLPSPIRPLPTPGPAINPNPFIAPGLTLQQYAYNTAVIGRALSTVPPYAYGYNPYPAAVTYGPTFGIPGYVAPTYPFSSYPSAAPYFP